MTLHVDSVHKKLKPFACHECDFKTAANKNLIRHIETVHKQVKKFQCSFCEFKCSQKSNLDKHIYTFHNDDKVECPHCGFKPSQSQYLDKHIEYCITEKNRSIGEEKVFKVLCELGFVENKDFVYDLGCKELTKWSQKPLRFDFRFNNHKTVIEYDGKQHFQPARFGCISKEEAEEKFKCVQDYDKLKDNFCKKFGYKMIRISYKDFSKISDILTTELNDVVEWNE
jgi:very-short-patch-repair endonuclease